jgi:hypothetical protein
VALVLCEREGRSRIEAARQLGVPVGTLSSRLARGRVLLRDRLTRRGLAPVAAGAVATNLAREAGAAVVPAVLVKSTAGAALGFAAGSIATGAIAAPVLSLTRGVLTAMLLSKFKVMGLMVAGSLAFVAVGSGVLAQQGQQGGQPDQAAQPGQQDQGQQGPVSYVATQPAAPAPAPDRLGDLERKLDRVLEMLERPETGQQPPRGIPAVVPAPMPYPATAPPPGLANVPAPVSADNLATTVPAIAPQPVPARRGAADVAPSSLVPAEPIGSHGEDSRNVAKAPRMWWRELADAPDTSRRISARNR